MTLYNYKRFLGDSDKIVQKYFDLKEEVKKREIFRKIGLDKYFQPVTSVIRQELKPFHNLKEDRQQIIDRGYRGEDEEEEEMDRGEMDRGETEDLDTIVDDEETDYDDIENENKKIKEKENPYDELKNSKFNKNSENFANEWLEISEDLGYEKGQTNFDSFTNDDLIRFRSNLKHVQASSSKRTSNKYIQQYDNDVKNQLKIINNKIGKKKENEEEKKYEKDVKENKKINEMFKQTKLSEDKKKEGKGVKRGNNNGSSLIYYNNPQQLIDRLRLLVGSKRAGNTNPEIDSEIIGISDELVKKGLIMNYDYTNFMNKNLIKF